MNKLQLYIYKSLRGFKSVRNINPAENVQRHIRDVRQALETIDYDPAEKYLFYLLSYVEEGSFFTILRTIPDKPLDHLATTIYIPSGLQISSEELAAIVHRTTRMVSNPAVSAEELNELHEVFAKEYPLEPDTSVTVESEGRQYAFSYYGGETGRNLEDFFGDKLYQTEFIKYAGVLLVDAALGVNVNAVDISDYPLCPPATIFPPEHVKGFVPYLYGRRFERPFRVSLGEVVELIWKRSGFDDIRQEVNISEREQSVNADSLDGSRKTITRATFFITSHAGKTKIDDAEIIVNGIEISGEHSFSYDELKNADVIVRCQGYLPYQATLDLASTTQALIAMPEQRRVYRFEMPVKSSELGAPIRFEIHTKRQLKESPLEGYSLIEEIKEGMGKSNHLEYTGGSSNLPFRQIVWYVVGSLIMGFILGWIFMGGGKESTPETEEVEVVTEQVKVGPSADAPKQAQAEVKPAPTIKEDEKPKQPEATKSAATSVTAESIAYLDGNAKWTKEQLDRLPGLAGLFDDMNQFHLDKLSGEWAEKLKKSKRFERVAHHAGEGLRKQIFKPSGTYCTGGDNTITVQSYLNRIDPAKKQSK